MATEFSITTERRSKLKEIVITKEDVDNEIMISIDVVDSENMSTFQSIILTHRQAREFGAALIAIGQ